MQRSRTLRWGMRIALLLLLAAVAVAGHTFDQHRPPLTGPTGHRTDPIPPRFYESTHTIRSGDIITGVLQRIDLPAAPILEAARPHYDLARIRAGREVTVRHDRVLAAPVAFRYPIDEDRTLVATRTEAGDWTAEITEREYEVRPDPLRIEIRSSLWAAAVEQGVRPSDILRLAEIYQWEVDFNSELREGAVLSLVADGLYDGDTRVRLGDIHATCLYNDGERTVAIRHLHPDGSEDYYDPEGQATRRPFLRSPLAFMRISSGFSTNRLHPVLGVRRPHYGTDFAAPTGTPVRAVGDGTVILAAWNGGHGRQVRVRHPTGHISGYSHLQRILVRKGERVRQGQVVGKVGSSGLATGPHCHYELRYQGRYLDPMTADLPTSEPLPAAERDAFEEQRDRWLPTLMALADGTDLPAVSEGEPSHPETGDHVP